MVSISDRGTSANHVLISDRAFDGDLETFYDAPNNNNPCYVGLDFGEKWAAEVSGLRYFLKINKDSELFLDTVFEVSDDTTTWTEVAKFSEIMMDGWNFWQVESGETKPKGRYVRLRHTSESQCQFAEIEVEGIVLLSTDIPDLEQYECDATV